MRIFITEKYTEQFNEMKLHTFAYKFASMEVIPHLSPFWLTGVEQKEKWRTKMYQKISFIKCFLRRKSNKHKQENAMCDY